MTPLSAASPVDSANLAVILEWASSLRDLGLSASNVTERRRALTRFARWLNGALLTATPEDVEQFLEAEAPQGRKAQYRLTAPILDFYEWAVAEGLADVAPVERTRFRKRRGLLYRDAADMAALLEGFRIAQERRSLARETITHRAGVLRLLAESVAPRSILTATAEDIELHLDGRALGAKARYSAISTMHAFYTWAIKAGHALQDPTADIDRPRLPRALPRPIDDADLAEALRQAPPIIGAWIALAAYAGLRCKEIAQLHRDDVVEYSDPPVLVVREGKGRKDRVVPLHPEIARALSRIDGPRGGYYFTKRNGQPVLPYRVSSDGSHYLHDIGIAATMHQCRHWFGTRLYGATLDLRLVQEMLGHSSPTTTASYAAFTPTKAAAAVRSLAVLQ